TIQGTGAGAKGIVFNGATNGTVTNSGTIAGNGGKAIQFANGNDRLIVDPGAMFTGAVAGAGGANTMELAAGGTGTITGLGVSFTNFGQLTVDTGASWRISGAHNTIGSNVTFA